MRLPGVDSCGAAVADDLRARIAKLEADLKTGMDAKARVEADRDLRDRELGDLRTRLAGPADLARLSAALPEG